MPARTTVETVLALRRVEEDAAIRRLERARAALERAEAAQNRARATHAALTERLGRAATLAASDAGALGRRDAYRRRLRSELDAAAERVALSERAGQAARQELEAARQAVERALAERKAAEAQAKADAATLARDKASRADASHDDRRKPPKR